MPIIEYAIQPAFKAGDVPNTQLFSETIRGVQVTHLELKNGVPLHLLEQSIAILPVVQQ